MDMMIHCPDGGTWEEEGTKENKWYRHVKDSHEIGMKLLRTAVGRLINRTRTFSI